MIKAFLRLGDRYAAKSDWTDFALTKFCLFSMGLLVGAKLPEKYKKGAICAAIAVFAATYVPLMWRLAKVAVRKD